MLLDFRGALPQDRSGVKLFNQRHRGNARLLFAVDDRPVDRRCAAIFWQQREMNIDATVTGSVQKVGGQDAPVSDDDCNISIVRHKKVASVFGSDSVRLLDLKIMSESEFLYCGLLRGMLMATGRSVGLGPDGSNLVPVGEAA